MSDAEVALELLKLALRAEPAQVDDDIRKAERALEKMEQEKARKEELEIMRRKCAVLGIKI